MAEPVRGYQRFVGGPLDGEEQAMVHAGKLDFPDVIRYPLRHPGGRYVAQEPRGPITAYRWVLE